MGFTRTTGSLVGWAIERVTGRWHHGLIAFGETHPVDYYEAHASSKHGKGFRGPKPVGKLVLWAADRGHELEWIEITPLLSEAGPYRLKHWCETEANRHRTGYDVWQLVRMWLVRRFLFRWFDVHQDASRLICSEAQTRAMWADGIDLCGIVQRSSADDMSPTDVYRACWVLLINAARK